MSGKAAFLDRDGVINRDTGYVRRVQDFALLPGVPQALRLLAQRDFALVVVTNQSGIGRGYFAEEDYRQVTRHMQALLAAEGVTFAAILHCPHHPDAGCSCRKPLPGLIEQGLAATGSVAGASVLFGDKPSDIAAGRAAGIGTCVLVGGAEAPPHHTADDWQPDLLAAVRHCTSDPQALQHPIS